MSGFKSLEFKDGMLIILDQTKLPFEEEYIISDDYRRIGGSIMKLEIRGAPAIGIAAAYALALSLKNSASDHHKKFYEAYGYLASTRPTAVNLFWALNKLKNRFENSDSYEGIYEGLLSLAGEIHIDDIKKCDRIAANGLQIFTKKMNVLTHCNTGKLATGGEGTALNVIKRAFAAGLVEHVFVDETRPLLQGARLTAFELEKEGIPFSVITDSTAAFLMQKGKVDIVITGADRIAANGDSANKIGTYSLALACRHHKIPFYIAAPVTTIDADCMNGAEIEIELRGKEEINSIKGVAVTKSTYGAYSPAFDVTPAELISGIITDEKLHKPVYKF